MSESRKKGKLYNYRAEGNGWRIYYQDESRVTFFLSEEHARCWVKVVNEFVNAPAFSSLPSENRFDILYVIFEIMRERGMVV